MTLKRIITGSSAILLLITLSFFGLISYLISVENQRTSQQYQEALLSQVALNHQHFRYYLDTYLDEAVYPETVELSHLLYSQIIEDDLTEVPLHRFRTLWNAGKYHFFLINHEGEVVNTTYPPDQGLNLLELDEEFAASFRQFVESKDQLFWTPGLAAKTGANENWIFTYYKPPESSYVIQIGIPSLLVNEMMSNFQAIIDSYQQLPEVTSVSIYRPGVGVLFGEPVNLELMETSISRAISQAETVEHEYNMDGQTFIQYVVPVEFGAGYLEQDLVIMTVPKAIAYMPSLTPYFLAFVLLFIITVFGINRHLNKRISKPLEELTNFTSEVSASSLVESRFNPLNTKYRMTDELMQFYQSFFRFLGDIQSHEEEIQAQTRELEEQYSENLMLSQRLSVLLDSFTNIHSLGKREFFQQVFHELFLLIPEAEKGAVFELKDDVFYPVAFHGYEQALIKQLSFRKEESIYYSADVRLDQVDTYIVEVEEDRNHVAHHTKEILAELGTLGNFKVLFAPILVEGNILGAISLDNFDGSVFSQTSRDILRYYAQLVTEFYNHRLNQEKITRTYFDVVTALISAIEIKDAYTMGHGKRVSQYSRQIAECLDLAREEVRDIELAALLHDIGKIGIPEEILQKPARLTDEEFNVIKEHPVFSKQIIEKISGFEKMAQYVYHHHEHYDGGGYPTGLKGDSIPLGSQIIQVADAFDAMTSKRSYRPPLSKEQATEILLENKGTQFNPYLVELAVAKVFSAEKQVS